MIPIESDRIIRKPGIWMIPQASLRLLVILWDSWEIHPSPLDSFGCRWSALSTSVGFRGMPLSVLSHMWYKTCESVPRSYLLNYLAWILFKLSSCIAMLTKAWDIENAASGFTDLSLSTLVKMEIWNYRELWKYRTIKETSWSRSHIGKYTLRCIFQYGFWINWFPL